MDVMHDTSEEWIVKCTVREKGFLVRTFVFECIYKYIYIFLLQ